MKTTLIICCVALLAVQPVSSQQTPKWVEKAKRAVVSVVTYDKDGRMLHSGNGFFIADDGTALSDYSLFKDAARAVVVTPEGREMNVDRVMGANSLYDVIKFRVDISGKKVPALTLSAAPSKDGDEVWMLPYSTQKSIACTAGTVKTVATVAGEYPYYTLSMSMKEKMVSCPVMNAAGEVIGLAQKSSRADSLNTCYAIGAKLAEAQQINALSMADASLRSIGIRKGLPPTEDQALVYLFVASTQLDASDYKSLLDDFVAAYPSNSEGYLRRAAHYMGTADNDKAAADMAQAVKVASKKDEVCYNLSKLIYGYLLTKPAKPHADWTYEKALAHLRTAQEQNPLPLYTQLEGDIYFALQDYAKSLEAYRKVNESPLASPASYFSAAKAAELLKSDPKEIVTLMDSCVARITKPVQAQDAVYLLERAQAYMNNNQARQAVADYDAYFEAVKGQVNDVFYFYREQAALKSRQYQRALDDIAKAIELNPDELSYRTEAGVINLRVGRYEEAVRELDHVIGKTPEYAEAYRLRGLCHAQMKKTKEAEADFVRAKELGDPHAEEMMKKYVR